MNSIPHFTAFFIGWGIGFFSSVLGVLLQSRIINTGDSTRLPNFIFPVTGILGLIGFATLIIGLFTGSIAVTISVGIGVINGFFLGFLVVIVLRIIAAKQSEAQFNS